MALRQQTLPEKTRKVQQAALRYCESADRNLKVALLQAEQNMIQAKEQFLRHEEDTSMLSKKYPLARLSKIMEIAKTIVNDEKVDMGDLKQSEIEDMNRYYIPYIRKMSEVSAKTKEFDLIKQKIEINAETYMLYKSEIGE